MVQKNTIICDVCDETISNRKCDICSKDICEGCTQEIPLGFIDESVLLNIYTCERCKKQFSRICLSESSEEENIFQQVMNDKPELKKEIIEMIKNIIMLKKISEEDMQKEEEEEKNKSSIINIGGLFPNPQIYPTKPYKRKPYPYRPIDEKWKKWYLSPDEKKKKWWGGIK